MILSTNTRYKININDNENFSFSDNLRQKADKILDELDLPNSHLEEWKYTRLTKLKNNLFEFNDSNYFQTKYTNEIKNFNEKFVIPNIEGSKIVFINGIYNSELSEIQNENGIEIKSINETKNFNSNIPLENNFFNSFNTFYTRDGVNINITKNSLINQVIQLIFIDSGENSFVSNRNIINIEESSNVHLIFNYLSDNSIMNFSSCISEIFVSKNAKLTIDKIQQTANKNIDIHSEYIYQERDSQITLNSFSFGGDLTRNDINVEILGQNCETNLFGIYLTNNSQHIDNHTTIYHREANCLSNENYKGVMNNKSTAVFNGKVYVNKDAQKINAYQSNSNILLSDDANINSKPELEIYANDVKCSHGSTVGQLNEDAIFYLKSRGISAKKAKYLLVNAFLNEIVEKIEIPQLKNYLLEKIESNLKYN